MNKLNILSYFLVLGFVMLTVQPTSPPTSPTANKVPFQKVGEAPQSRKGLYKVQFLDSSLGWAFDSVHLWKSGNAGKQWELLYPTKASPERLKIEGLHFVSPTAGWMITLSQLHQTGDGGRTWKERRLFPGLNRVEFRTLTFLDDAMHGWIAGGLYLPVKDGATSELHPNNTISVDQDSVLFGAIFVTTDGGATWQKMAFPQRVGRIYEVHMFSPEKGWALGDAGIFSSQDGKWTPLRLSSSKCLTEEFLGTIGYGKNPVDSYEPSAGAFPSSELGWIAFKNGFMIQTKDAGKTWCSSFKPRSLWPRESYNAFFAKLYFVSAKDGFAMGADQRIYGSSDGGLSWVRVYPTDETSDPVNDIFFLDDRTGWVATNTAVLQLRR